MIKIKIEDTDRNETYEYEGESMVYALLHTEEDRLGVMTGALGSFSECRLKKIQKSIKKMFKNVYKAVDCVE